MSDSHVLLVSAAYLMIASANKKRRKKRYLWVKNYLKTRNFDSYDSCTGEIISGLWREITSGDNGLMPLQ